MSTHIYTIQAFGLMIEGNRVGNPSSNPRQVCWSFIYAPGKDMTPTFPAMS